MKILLQLSIDCCSKYHVWWVSTSLVNSFSGYERSFTLTFLIVINLKFDAFSVMVILSVQESKNSFEDKNVFTFYFDCTSKRVKVNAKLCEKQFVFRAFKSCPSRTMFFRAQKTITFVRHVEKQYIWSARYAGKIVHKIRKDFLLFYRKLRQCWRNLGFQ